MKYVYSFEEKYQAILNNQIRLFTLIYKMPEPNQKYISPFRVDNNPGCYFILSNKRLRFIDWGDFVKSRDIFDFASKLYSMNFHYVIDYLFEILLSNKTVILPELDKNFIQKNKATQTKIKVKKRYFNKEDIAYWKRYNLNLKDLVNTNGNFKIIPISKYQIEKNKKEIIIPQNITYAYSFTKGIKIYSPYSTNYKWRNNVSKDIIGISNKKHKSIILTKSVKDSIILNKIGLDYAFFQSETSFPNNNVIKYITSKYNNISILFDNDKTGRQYSKKLYYLLRYTFGVRNLKSVFTPNANDTADFVERFSINNVRDILQY